MASVPQRLKELRKISKLTQADVAKFLNISESAYGYYEQGRNEIAISSVQRLAEKYNVSVAYILCETDIKQPVKLSKDERDIAKKLESILGDLDNGSSLAFNGEPMDDHTRELVRAQIESNLRVAKEMARKKFTPKKYQTDDND